MHAHAVDHHAAFFAGGRHHLTARAHAKRVHSASVRQMRRQLVVSGTQCGMIREITVLRLVDHALRMLDTHAHREWFPFHEQAFFLQQRKRVARGMTACQNNGRSRYALTCAARRVFQYDTCKLVITKRQVNQLAIEANFAAMLDNLLAQRFYHGTQLIGANMGFCINQNLFRRPRLGKPLQNRLCKRVFRIRGQLAIGKRAGATFAKLDVCRRIKLARFLEVLHRGNALIHTCTALYQQRTQTRARQIKRREQTRRTRAHHHGSLVVPRKQRFRQTGNNKFRDGDARFHIASCAHIEHGSRTASLVDNNRGIRFNICLVDKRHFLAFRDKRDRQRHNEMNCAFLTRVHAFLQDAHRIDAIQRHVQLIRHRLEQHAFALRKRPI